ncbi:M14 family zinc carboxypeptidase [Deinococcus lacus]|uniref:M14 family zinc carboxypeptidase n=1 Tax=Deinococcus lacus TaxID=392561 RepID=A0ABW1Y9Q6_9DEIO
MKKVFGATGALTLVLTLAGCQSAQPAPVAQSPETTLAAQATPEECAAFEQGAEQVVTRVDYTNLAAARAVAVSFEPFVFDREQQYLLISASKAEFERLRASGQELGFTVSIEKNLTAEQQALAAGSLSAQAISSRYPCFRTVPETYAAAQALVKNYPALATWQTIGKTAGGNPIYELVLTNKSVTGTKPRAVLNSAIHAREYATAELNLRLAEKLAAEYGTDPDTTWILDSQEIHFVFMANPDGRAKAETGLLWRKNVNTRYCASGTNKGADLNRNFSFGWNTGGSSKVECDETYMGPSAASEGETQAIQGLLRKTFTDRRGPGLTEAAPSDTSGIYIDIHSAGRLNLWPWGASKSAAPNGAALENLGRKFSFYNGHDPMQAVGLYPASGGSDDFAYGDLGVAAFTFELGDDFFESCTNFTSDILPNNINALKYALKVARAPYQMASAPDAVNVSVSGTALTATVKDTQTVGAATQTIRSAEYFVDTPPWAGGTGTPMTATDGSFNSGSEAVKATLNLSGLSAGRHTIYVRATDSSGATGPVSAAFVTVGGSAPTPAPTPGGTSYTGTVSSGQTVYQPGTAGFSYAGGTLAATLSGPAGSDYDLYLQKQSSTGVWNNVASSYNSDSNESISYTALSGTYRWAVKAYSGSGSYTLAETK